MAVIERFKQESMYGLMTKKWPLVEVGLLVLQRCIPAHKYICLYFLSRPAFFQCCLKNISEKMGNLPSQKGKQIVSVLLFMVFSDQNK